MPIDITKMSEIEINDLALTATRVIAPTFHASTINLQWAGNDGILIFARPQPATLPPLGEMAPFGLSEVTAIMHLSSATLKDLSILLAEQIAGYEKKAGAPIETDYTRRLAAMKVAAPASKSEIGREEGRRPKK
jgi:hypothetical protein